MRLHMQTLLAFYCLVMAALVLWPYKFALPCRSCKNGAFWIADENRIEFRAPGMVRSVAPPIELHERLRSGTGFSIEAWLATASLDQAGPARIVSYSRDPLHRNFTLGQEKGDLVFRLRTTETDLNAMSLEITAPGIFVPEKRQQIVISYDFMQYRIYVDGHLRESARAPGGTFQNWDPSYRLFIGNEQTGDRPWLGSIERVVLYNRPVSEAEVLQSHDSGRNVAGGLSGGADSSFELTAYQGGVTFDESGVQRETQLEIPVLFSNESTPEFLSLKPRDVTDFISNFLLYVPFGFLLLLSLPGSPDSAFRAVTVTFMATLLVALITESSQYYVDARTSSLFDLASSLAGGLAGSWAAVAFRPFLQPNF